MRLTPENKAKLRARIRAAAAEAMRRDGFGAVNLDRLMAGAGLTRGTFYAHFPSKSALFAEIMRHEHPLLRMLKARTGEDAATLRAELDAILRDYLAPEHLEQVFEGCSICALTGDAARADAEVRAGFELAWEEIVIEMARAQRVGDRGLLRAALTLATGAVTTARACAAPDARAEILKGARDGVSRLLDLALGLVPDSPRG